MKFVVMGAGAIGSAFGGFLRRAGHDVTLIGRKHHLDAIEARGLRISGIWGDFVVTGFSCHTSARDVTAKPDAILVCVKSFDTRQAAFEVDPLLGTETLLVSLQNGVGNLESLRDITQHPLILGGRVIFGVVLAGPGTIEITVYTAPVMIGYAPWLRPVAMSAAERVRRMVAAINEAGIPCEYTEEIEKHIWAKLLYNCALNPLSAVHGVPYGALAEKPEWRRIMEGIVREIFAVAQAEGIPLFWNGPEEFLVLFYRKLLPDTASHRSSMLQDLRTGRPTEIDSLCGVIVRLGRKHGIPTPFNQRMIELIHTRSGV
ncbi:MAG: ketopantoate reductase family protein [Kiritimatiellia bacterium]